MKAGEVAARFASPTGLAALGVLAVLGVGAWAFLRYRNNGGARQMAQDVVSGTVEAGAAVTAGAVTGLVTAVTEPLGITPPRATITDVQRARELIGQYGFWRASRDVEALTLFQALREGPAYYGNEGHGR